MRRGIVPSCLVLLSIALVGCTIFAPQMDPSRFYVLTSTTEASGESASRAANGLAIGLGPLKLPDYLNRSQVVTRVGPNRVVFSDFERWAEPLERNFSRIMIENLVALLNTEKIVSLPTFIPVALDYRVPIEVQRFEADKDGNVELRARWAVRSAGDGTIVRTGESHIIEQSAGSTEAVVAALSNAVGKMSREIAAAIRSVSAS